MAPVALLFRTSGQAVAMADVRIRTLRQLRSASADDPAGDHPARRRFFALEVVQTSSMDCGPASLKCLLEGFRISISYPRLQEACQTDVDGTSINALEQIAVRLGLEAEQIMIPVDHLLLPRRARCRRWS